MSPPGELCENLPNSPTGRSPSPFRRHPSPGGESPAVSFFRATPSRRLQRACPRGRLFLLARPPLGDAVETALLQPLFFGRFRSFKPDGLSDRSASPHPPLVTVAEERLAQEARLLSTLVNRPAPSRTEREGTMKDSSEISVDAIRRPGEHSQRPRDPDSQDRWEVAPVNVPRSIILTQGILSASRLAHRLGEVEARPRTAFAFSVLHDRGLLDAVHLLNATLSSRRRYSRSSWRQPPRRDVRPSGDYFRHRRRLERGHFRSGRPRDLSADLTVIPDSRGRPLLFPSWKDFTLISFAANTPLNFFATRARRIPPRAGAGRQARSCLASTRARISRKHASNSRVADAVLIQPIVGDPRRPLLSRAGRRGLPRSSARPSPRVRKEQAVDARCFGLGHAPRLGPSPAPFSSPPPTSAEGNRPDDIGPPTPREFDTST